MPTNRTRRQRDYRGLLPEVWEWLNDRSDGWLEIYLLSDQEKADLWSQHREEIVNAWIDENPCTRPAKWWDYDAPRDPKLMKKTFWENKFPIMRKLMSGAGVPEWVAQPAYLPEFEKAVPRRWSGYDPSDAPTFESEASYLQKFNLLTAVEKKYLEKHPELLEPVVINYE